MEVALVRTRRDRLKQRVESGTDRVEAVMQVDRELTAGLLTARVGALFGAVLGGWAGAIGLAPAARRLLGAADHPLWGALVALCAYLLVGIVVASFGHVAARRLALARRAQGATGQGAAARLFSALTLPLAALSARLGGAALRRSPGDASSGGDLTEDELNLLILSSYRQGTIGAAQRELIGRVFGHTEELVRDVMTPRSEMACIPSSMRAGEAIEVARQFGFTRFPICEGGKDRVIGVVHYRDLIDAKDQNARLPVTDAMRPAVGVGPDLPVSEALAVMQQHRAHMAIVTDDGGASVGLVTVEDLLSSMVSPPAPEGDSRVRETGKGVFEFGGDLLVDEVEDALGVDLQRVGVETIGAYLFGRFGRRPKEGDSIKIAGIVFDVLEVRGARIRRLRAQRSREAVPIASVERET